MSEIKELTIKELNISGKWLEFWVEEETRLEKIFDYEENKLTNEDYEAWTYSCKTYMFEEAITKAGLDDYVYNNGRIGLKVVWQRNGMNWDLIEVKK